MTLDGVSDLMAVVTEIQLSLETDKQENCLYLPYASSHLGRNIHIRQSHTLVNFTEINKDLSKISTTVNQYLKDRSFKLQVNENRSTVSS